MHKSCSAFRLKAWQREEKVAVIHFYILVETMFHFHVLFDLGIMTG